MATKYYMMDVDNFRWGADQVSRLYMGQDLVWPTETGYADALLYKGDGIIEVNNNAGAWGSGVSRIYNGVFSADTSYYAVICDGTITTISSGSFSGKTGLLEIVLPSRLQSIGKYAFSRCYFSRLSIPNSVTTISDHAFSGCTNLRNFEIGNGLSVIDNYTFAGCRTLGLVEKVSIPDNVTTINMAAFYDCRYLTSIEFGTGLTNIGYMAFNGCALSSITCNSIIAPVVDNFTFTITLQQYGTLYYPQGSDYSSWITSIQQLQSNWTFVEI